MALPQCHITEEFASAINTSLQRERDKKWWIVWWFRSTITVDFRVIFSTRHVCAWCYLPGSQELLTNRRLFLIIRSRKKGEFFETRDEWEGIWGHDHERSNINEWCEVRSMWVSKAYTDYSRVDNDTQLVCFLCCRCVHYGCSWLYRSMMHTVSVPFSSICLSAIYISNSMRMELTSLNPKANLIFRCKLNADSGWHSFHSMSFLFSSIHPFPFSYKYEILPCKWKFTLENFPGFCRRL